MAFTAPGLYSRLRATVSRYFADKKWGFHAPGKAAEAATAAPAAEAFPDYPPWELDPAFLAQSEAGARAPGPAANAGPAPSRSSPRAQETAPETATNSDQTLTVSWEALTPRTAPLPMAEPTASRLPAPGQDAVAPPAPAAPASPVAPPAPTTATGSRAPGGRHRKV